MGPAKRIERAKKNPMQVRPLHKPSMANYTRGKMIPKESPQPQSGGFTVRTRKWTLQVIPAKRSEGFDRCVSFLPADESEYYWNRKEEDALLLTIIPLVTKSNSMVALGI